VEGVAFDPERLARAVAFLLILAFVVWRLLRYLRLGAARRPLGVPGGAGLVPGAAPAADARLATPERRLSAAVAAAGAWLLVNVLLALALFALPPLAGVPLLWRLCTLVFANFYLLPFAGRLRARWSERPGDAPGA